MPPWWSPEIFARKMPALAARQKITQAVRQYFAAQDFHEVTTPALQVSPGLEVHLHAFETAFNDPHGGAPRALYLHTSPEFTMKKLLAAGMPRLYQLAQVYRNNERSSLHHPEFTMLEWYRAHAGYRDLMEDCVALVRAAATVCGKTSLVHQDISCDPFADWEVLTLPEAFRRYCAIDLLATMPAPHTGDTERLRAEAARLEIRTAPDDDWDNIFFRILGERIEPHLGKDRPVFLTDYPVSQAALARPKPEEPRLAERFELYLCGVEIANAFGELTDPDEQRRRFAADMDAKEKLYGERYPLDEDFLAALAHMPPAAGIALGFDRLIMLCTGAAHIEDVLWAPVAG
ncbi:MAG: EF-P lysine aminoacylase EpmA [Alphaproteobacteria bacterium]